MKINLEIIVRLKNCTNYRVKTPTITSWYTIDTKCITTCITIRKIKSPKVNWSGAFAWPNSCILYLLCIFIWKFGEIVDIHNMCSVTYNHLIAFTINTYIKKDYHSILKDWYAVCIYFSGKILSIFFTCWWNKTICDNIPNVRQLSWVTWLEHYTSCLHSHPLCELYRKLWCTVISYRRWFFNVSSKNT